MARTVDIKQLETFAAPVVAGLGYELCDLEWKHEAGGWILRLFIDGPSGISHEDCVRVSRAVSAELDLADPIAAHYSLEVSSPGLNRPLRAEQDFRRFLGQRARIRTLSSLGSDNPRRNFAGTLRGAESGKVRIDVDGTEFEIDLVAIEKANLEYEY